MFILFRDKMDVHYPDYIRLQRYYYYSISFPDTCTLLVYESNSGNFRIPDIFTVTVNSNA